MRSTRCGPWLLVAASVLSAIPAAAEEVGSFTNDWTGNEIVVEAIEDPKSRA